MKRLILFLAAILAFASAYAQQPPTAEELNELGKEYDSEENYTEAIKYFRQAAEMGYPNAQFNLGMCYANGEGVEQDYAQALKWYGKAAEQGFPRAIRQIGAMYYLGAGVAQDYTEAAKWFKRAAELEDSDAQTMLGAMYLLGEGVAKDYHEALIWFAKAALQDHNDAIDALRSLENILEGTTFELNSLVLTFKDRKFTLGTFERIITEGTYTFNLRTLTGTLNHARVDGVDYVETKTFILSKDLNQLTIVGGYGETSQDMTLSFAGRVTQ